MSAVPLNKGHIAKRRGHAQSLQISTPSGPHNQPKPCLTHQSFSQAVSSPTDDSNNSATNKQVVLPISWARRGVIIATPLAEKAGRISPQSPGAFNDVKASKMLSGVRRLEPITSHSPTPARPT